MRTFLFSVDLEDPRYSEARRLYESINHYLALLDNHGMHATFFVVGEVAERHPELIHRIGDCGHELACHTSTHTYLDHQSRQSFREDLMRNRDALERSGCTDCVGFRAPAFSLTQKTRWAYDVLAELNFLYSSSVLPCLNPLYGWVRFGVMPRRTKSSVWEIPISVSDGLGVKIPFSGGIYFRVLPFDLTRFLFHCQLARKGLIVSYFHPYDIDPYMSPRKNNPVLNFLMSVNSKRCLDQLKELTEELITAKATILPFRKYVAEHLEANGEHLG